MWNRCIMIFTQFTNIDKINELREKYDPAVNSVAPHITLVFPFKSDICGSEIKKHIEKNIQGMKPFNVKLQGISAESENYLFLNVIQGKEELTELHNRFYSDILEKFKPEFLETIEFKPHLTLGKIDDNGEFIQAVKDTKGFDEMFEMRVNKITVEIIGENQESIIETEVKFK